MQRLLYIVSQDRKVKYVARQFIFPSVFINEHTQALIIGKLLSANNI